MLCTTRNIQARITDQTRQNPADKGTGMPHGCDIAVVDHRMTLPADQAISRGFSLGKNSPQLRFLPHTQTFHRPLDRGGIDEVLHDGVINPDRPCPVRTHAKHDDLMPQQFDPGRRAGATAPWVRVLANLRRFCRISPNFAKGKGDAQRRCATGERHRLQSILCRHGSACRTLDTISVFALTVADTYEVFRTAAAFDPADSFARDIGAPALVKPKASPRIGIPSAESIRFEGDELQKTSFNDAISTLEDAGAEISEIDFSPLFAIAEMLYSGCWVAERYVATESLLKTHPDGMFPVTRKIIESAESKTAADAFRDFYRLKEFSSSIAPVLEQHDALCIPTIPTLATVADLEADAVGPNNMLGTYTNFVNLKDMCGISVPTAPRPDGRPGSVTILAKAGSDAEAAALATILEASPTRSLGATGWPMEGISLPERPAPDMFRIAVCGAHMLGLPLNHTLTQRGATFVPSHTTAADYTFHALSGSGIARPGLIRTAEGKGANIAVELWDMPCMNLGSFMRTVPSPLTIGTIILSDDTTVQGFLCQPFAAVDATDITAIADWRAYLAQRE